MSALLSLDDLSVCIGTVTLLEASVFTLDRGEILGLVGESGSGKSLTAMAIMGLLPLIGGRITGWPLLFDGTDLASLVPSRPAQAARPPHRLHHPEPDDGARSGAAHRRADRRGGAPASGADPGRRRARARSTC